MKKKKPDKQQKRTRQKSSVATASPAKFAKPRSRATKVSRTAEKATGHTHRSKKVSARKGKPRSNAAINVFSEAMHIWDSVPQPFRDATGDVTASLIDEWFKETQDTNEAEQSSPGTSARIEALSICFFAPAINNAQAFCERVFEENFFWSDEAPAKSGGAIRVRRCQNSYDLATGAKKALKSFINDADLVIFAADMGEEVRGSSTVLPVANMVKELAGSIGVPAVFLVINAKADIIPSGYSSSELADARERWLRIMWHKKTEFVDEVGCAREDVVAWSLAHKVGSAVAVKTILAKLPVTKRALLLDALSSDLCPEELKEAPSSFDGFVNACGGHLKHGARHVWQFLRENPWAWDTAKGLIIGLAQSFSSPAPKAAKRKR